MFGYGVRERVYNGSVHVGMSIRLDEDWDGARTGTGSVGGDGTVVDDSSTLG